jgi:hypothetical protein
LTHGIRIVVIQHFPLYINKIQPTKKYVTVYQHNRYTYNRSNTSSVLCWKLFTIWSIFDTAYTSFWEYTLYLSSGDWLSLYWDLLLFLFWYLSWWVGQNMGFYCSAQYNIHVMNQPLLQIFTESHIQCTILVWLNNLHVLRVCKRYMCTRREPLFFTILPHLLQTNGPLSTLWTSRMWILRFVLFTNTLMQYGHLALWLDVDHAEPENQESQSLNMNT